MFVHHDAAAAVAIQEIEVISMADGEDNVTTTSIALPPSMVASSSSWSWSSSSSSHPRHTTTESSPALDALLAMLDGETTLPVVDHVARSSIIATPISTASSASSADGSRHDPVNDDDRTKMCDWYYEMSDYLRIDMATASRSLSLLDRFMAAPVHRTVGNNASSRPPFTTTSSAISSSSHSTSSSSSSPCTTSLHRHHADHRHGEHGVAGVVVAASRIRDEYQLAALTALFLSIKLCERLDIQLEHASYLSRGRYTPGEVMRMELVMLRALDWRACRADKVDYVNAYLDVMMPMTEDPHVDDPRHRTLQSRIKDLANLQIRMSDYDSTYSKQRPSLVAFASVINAFDIMRGDMSDNDRRRFLESAHGLMSGMDHRERREELPRTAERLRALVTPPPPSNWYFVRGGRSMSPPSCIDTILQHDEIYTCREGGGVRGMNVDEISPSYSETDSRRYHPKVSPLDAALESMENLNVARLLCCGSMDQTFHRHDGSNDDMQHLGNHERMMPGKKQRRCRVATSGRGDGMAKSQSSPTSISSIIFGAASKKV
jgi:hypothetical protein